MSGYSYSSSKDTTPEPFVLPSEDVFDRIPDSSDPCGEGSEGFVCFISTSSARNFSCCS